MGLSKSDYIKAGIYYMVKGAFWLLCKAADGMGKALDWWDKKEREERGKGGRHD